MSVSNGIKEKTEVLYGTENIIISAIEGYSRVKESLIRKDQHYFLQLHLSGKYILDLKLEV